MLRGPSFIFWITGSLCLWIQPTWCQTPVDRIPTELLERHSDIEEIHLFQKSHDRPLLRYHDTPSGFGNSGTLIRSKDRLFYLPSGTGQVLTVTSTENGLELVREDSTHLHGYNNDSFNFIFRDTLYSFGGYGFWKFNGHLRFYIPNNHEWEILPLTQERFFARSRSSPWLDPKSGTIIYAAPAVMPYLLGVHRPSAHYSDTTSVWKIHIPSQEVSYLGRATARALEILNNDQSIVGTEMGLIHFSTGVKHKQLHILDYQNNRVNILSREVSGEIARFFERFWASDDPGEVMVIYRRKNSVGMYFPPDNRLIVHLTEKDVSPTGDRIYEPPEIPETESEQPLSTLHLLVFFLISSMAANVVFYRQNRIKGQNAEQIVFDQAESALILHILNAPDRLLSTERVNEFLNIGDRSVDAQKKYRSEAIRTINRKFNQRTGKTENLIIQVKSVRDKRLLNYSILESNLAVLKKIIPDFPIH